MSRTRGLARAALGATGLLALGWMAVAHVRLEHPGNGNDLYWEGDSVSVVIQADGSEDVPFRGHIPALQTAIESWNSVSGTRLRLDENQDETQRARTDWTSDSIRLLWFDETNSSGYFPSGSGIVALTPVYFTSGGRIVDADVIFNGRAYRFTTSGESGAFDIADVGAHELGHLLGLDHSCWAGGTMYPYVDPKIIWHRSISRDEASALRSIKPSVEYATISGRIQRSSGGEFISGAHVVAREVDGPTVTSALTEADGSFQLASLEAGSYELYVAPLDGPVRATNLGVDRQIETDFETTLLGTHTVALGEVLALGDQAVGDDVSISIGRATDDYPLRLIQGSTVARQVRGSGLFSGGTLSTPDPSITISNVSYYGTMVQFSVSAGAGTALEHFDLEYTSSLGERTILTGAFEVTPPDPTVNLVTPASGDSAGGSPLTILGSGFRPGAFVVIGDRLYADGEPGGCTVEDSTTITLTTGSCVGGLHDVVVIDRSGAEGRLVSGFQASAVPRITSVFPSAGSVDGGTLLRVGGEDFVTGLSVDIDGVEQTGVDVVDSDLLEVFTETTIESGPALITVENPAGAVATTAFTFVDNPDPLVYSVWPDSGPREGGTEVVLNGANFVEGMSVRFGADPITGEGGTEAQSIELLGTGQLSVITPSTSTGSQSVTVFHPTTGQAYMLQAGFDFQGQPATSSGGGGGGGCGSIRPSPPGPPSLSRVVRGAGWFAVALALSVLLGARHRARGPQVSASA